MASTELSALFGTALPQPQSGHIVTLAPGSQVRETLYDNTGSPGGSSSSAPPPTPSTSGLGGSDRFRITSVLGSGTCEGLPAPGTSIVPGSLAIGREGQLGFHEWFVPKD